MILGLSLVLLFTAFMTIRHRHSLWNLQPSDWWRKLIYSSQPADKDPSHYEQEKEGKGQDAVQLDYSVECPTTAPEEIKWASTVEPGKSPEGIETGLLPTPPSSDSEGERTPKALSVSFTVTQPSDRNRRGGSGNSNAPDTPPEFELNEPAPVPDPLPTLSSARSLMPPPPSPLPASLRKAPPSQPSSSSLMPPPSLLAPPTSARAPASSTLSTSTLPATLRPREKVLLAPGHSPLDWALLSATHRARPQNPMYPETRISAAQLAACNGRLVKVRDGSGRKERRPVWMALGGVVYDVASYVDFHPGGVEQLMRGTGKDGTGLFLEAHGFVSWNSMLAGLEVARFVKDG